MIRWAESTYWHHYTQISRGMKRKFYWKFRFFFHGKMNEIKQTYIHTQNFEKKHWHLWKMKWNENKFFSTTITYDVNWNYDRWIRMFCCCFFLENFFKIVLFFAIFYDDDDDQFSQSEINWFNHKNIYISICFDDMRNKPTFFFWIFVSIFLCLIHQTTTRSSPRNIQFFFVHLKRTLTVDFWCCCWW